MCGIYGSNSVSKSSIVANMMQQSRHRGPDGSSTWSDENFFLGHNLLSIRDNPDLSSQPWVTPKGNILIFNGEIFNYKDLVSKYAGELHLETSCDTELLAWGLDKFGPLFINQIDSMHAFAFYDTTTKKLFLSRDHAGIKPLYYTLKGNRITFSSEILPLKDALGQESKVDKFALYSLFRCGINVTKNTLYDGISKVRPGETLEYDLKSSKISVFLQDHISPNLGGSYKKDEFLEKIETTINNSFVGIRKIGLFLSGGLDSSSILYFASKKGIDIEAFSCKFNDLPLFRYRGLNDDWRVAKRYSRELGIKFNTIDCNLSDAIECWENSAISLEEPAYGWSHPFYYHSNRFLSENNIVVTLAGDCGDELLGGYTRYVPLLNKEIRSFKELLSIWINRFSFPINNNLNFCDEDLVEYMYENTPHSLWNKDDIFNSYLALDCYFQTSEDFFMRNDKFGMRFSMEGRFPFASKEFMKYCLSIPGIQKIDLENSKTKLPMRDAMNGILPNYITTKKKTGWASPIILWAKRNKIMKKHLHQLSMLNSSLNEHILDKNFTSPKQTVFVNLLRSLPF